jgi:uncharacterized membrane protein YhiD involved in acid resistance
MMLLNTGDGRRVCLARWVAHGVGIAIGIAFIAAGSSTRVIGFVFVALNVVAGIGSEVARRRGSLAARELSRTYQASESDTFAALRSVLAERGYTVMSVDPEQRTLRFNTDLSRKTWSGQDFTATVRHTAGPKAAEIQLVGATSTRGLGSVQSVSWGETRILGDRVLDQVGSALAPG